MARALIILLCLLATVAQAQNPPLQMQQDGVNQGPATTLNCKGNVSCTKRGTIYDVEAGAVPTSTAATATATATSTATPTVTPTRTPNACATAASSWFGVFFGGQYGQSATDAPLCLPIPTVTVSATPTSTRTPTPTPTATGYVMGPQGCLGTDKVTGFGDAGEVLCGADLQAVAPTATAVTPTPTGTATPTPVACPTDALGRGGVIAAHPEKCGVPVATVSPTPTVTQSPIPTVTPDGPDQMLRSTADGVIGFTVLPDCDGPGLKCVYDQTSHAWSGVAEDDPEVGTVTEDAFCVGDDQGVVQCTLTEIPASAIDDAIARDSEIPTPYPTPTTAIPADCSELSGCEPDAIVCADVPGCQSADTINACSDVRACATTTPTPTESATPTVTVTPTAVACAANFVDAVVGPGSDAAATCVPIRTPPAAYPTPTVVESATPTPVVCATALGGLLGGLYGAQPELCKAIAPTVTAVVTVTPTPVACATDASGHLGGLYGANPELCKALVATVTPVPTPTAPYPVSVEESDVAVGSCQVHDFDGTVFDITISPTGECNYTLSANILTTSSAVQPSQLSRIAGSDQLRTYGNADQVGCKYNSTLDAFHCLGRPALFGGTVVPTPTPTETAYPTSTVTATAATPTIIVTPTPTATATSGTPVPTMTPALWSGGNALRRVATFSLSGNIGSGTLYVGPAGSTDTSFGANTSFRDAVRGVVPFKGHFENLQCSGWKDTDPGGRQTITIETGTAPTFGGASQVTHTWAVALRADMVGTRNTLQRDFAGVPYASAPLDGGAVWQWVSVAVNSGAGGWLSCTVFYVEDL